MPADRITPQDTGFSAKYWAFRIAAAVIPAVPAAIADPLARLAGLALYVAATGMRSKARHNLARVPGLQDARRRETVCREAFQHLARNYVDYFRVRLADDARIKAEYTVLHEDLYREALARGKGLIIVTAHIGNWELALARIGLFGHPVTIPAERLNPEKLFQLSCQLRTHHGVHLVPVDRKESLREMYAALARNEIVLLAIDRDVLSTGVPMTLFGEQTTIPTGGALLARRTGASVLWASSWRVAGGRSIGAFEAVEMPTPEPEGTGRERDGGEAALQRALAPQVALIERKVSEHPEQWSAVFTDIWPQRTAALGGAG
jgi:phosphatidylinositol dimannoside acyltransferase